MAVSKISIIAFWVICVFCLPVSALADEKKAELTLAEVVSRGIHTSPDYGIAANVKESTKQELLQAQALRLPSLDFQSESGAAHTATPTLSKERNLWANRGTLTLSQLLFDGWGTQNEIEHQKYRLETATKRVHETTELLGLDIVQAYLEVLRQRSLLQVARANVDKHAIFVETIDAGARAGTRPTGDVAQAQSRLNGARATASSIEENLRNAEALFIQKVGEMPGNMTMPEIPRDKIPASVEETVQQGIRNSLTLAVQEAAVKAAKAEYDASSSSFYPRVDLQGNASEAMNYNGVRGSQNSASALAVVKWRLYHGGADLAREQQFMYQHAEARERRAQAARQVEKEIRSTWAGKDAAANRTREFREQISANKKVVRAYLDQFSINKRTLLDVLDAQNELFISRLEHVNAIFTENFAVFRLLALQGKLLNTLNISPVLEARLEARK